MMKAVPVEEQLAIIKEFQSKQAANAGLDVKIADNSKADDFEFSIYQRKPPETGILSTLESWLGRSFGDAQKTIEQAKGKDHQSLYGHPIFKRTHRNGELTIDGFECKNRF
jgi:hypothetical protein